VFFGFASIELASGLIECRRPLAPAIRLIPAFVGRLAPSRDPPLWFPFHEALASLPSTAAVAKAGPSSVLCFPFFFADLSRASSSILARLSRQTPLVLRKLRYFFFFFFGFIASNYAPFDIRKIAARYKILVRSIEVRDSPPSF